MNYRKIAEHCLAKARTIFDEAEVFLTSSQAVSINLYNGALEQFEIAENGGFQLKVRKGGRWANVYSEKLDEAAVDDLIADAEQVLSIAEDNADMSLYKPQPGEQLPELQIRTVEPFDSEKAMAALMNLCRLTMEKSSEVKMANISGRRQESYTLILNTHGLDREVHNALAYALDYVVLERGGEMKSGMAFRIVKSLAEIPAEELACEALEKAAETYGAKSCAAGSYTLVLENEIFANLLSAFTYGFSAENVQKGMSLLAGKMGEKVGSDVLTLVDDPTHPDGFEPVNFDGEGLPVRRLPLLEKGVLKNYLHTMETAAKEEGARGGNASRRYNGGKSSPGVVTLVAEPGEKDFDALLAGVGEGLLITELNGLHSGLDPVSGDFSLPAGGFMIKDGKKDRPVNQITVAGNLLDLLKNITELGGDVKVTMSGAIVPSVVIKGLSVSGEE